MVYCEPAAPHRPFRNHGGCCPHDGNGRQEGDGGVPLLRAGGSHGGFADNDLTAIGVLEALMGHGLGVPGDVAASTLVGLTSIDQHSRELGRTAAATMLQRLSDPDREPSITNLGPTLVVRRTTDPSWRG
ncbi:LacI family DNA-binding transcriptional regulator [Arthrobacter sp. ISL-30]|nr:LacI family DNA-binding transcriptional regulator [Arthrobacter sp. ISL-30]